MINPLLLQTNRDIPFVLGLCSIHNPRISEIALIGEENFQIGSRFLYFKKNDYDFEDKTDLNDKSDFEILIEIMNSKEYSNFTQKAIMVLTLLFPSFEITIERRRIKLTRPDGTVTRIDDRNYDEFKEIIKEIFILESNEEGASFKPANGLAQRIAEKLERGRRKVSKQKGEQLVEKSIYGRMVSVLSVGLQKDKNTLMEYTVYQLLDEYKRFQLKLAFDRNIQARLAGASDLDDPEDWLDYLLL